MGIIIREAIGKVKAQQTEEMTWWGICNVTLDKLKALSSYVILVTEGL